MKCTFQNEHNQNFLSTFLSTHAVLFSVCSYCSRQLSLDYTQSTNMAWFVSDWLKHAEMFTFTRSAVCKTVLAWIQLPLNTDYVEVHNVTLNMVYSEQRSI